MIYYRIIEPYQRINLNCKCDSSSITNILRLLSGSVAIEYLPRNKILLTSRCFLIPLCNIPRFKRATIIYKSIDPSININDYIQFISVASRNNDEFYKTFLDEIVSFTISTDKQNYTTAFLHLYRLLEHISYAFPLLYISKAKDFKASYGYFKSYFEAQSGDRKNELSFFKSFMQIALKDDPILSTDIVFNLTGEIEYKKKHFELLKKNMNQDCISNACIQNEKFVILWHSLPSLVINIRNRYFHYTNSNPNNISLSDIVDAELFFCNINFSIIEWLSTVFTIILNNIYQNII